MSKAVKIKVYKMIVKSAVVFESETRAAVDTDMNTLGTWERKKLRKVHGPVVEQEIWRKRTNQELYKDYI